MTLLTGLFDMLYERPLLFPSQGSLYQSIPLAVQKPSELPTQTAFYGIIGMLNHWYELVSNIWFYLVFGNFYNFNECYEF